ncbi:hypothetical protein ACFSUS_04015 [Spirosoma soli]|uniref:Lipoprotein n=1 Tax=Spirosoma soli TaxID=1770529 RepID=A0ABW5LYM8_9BACT
MNYMIAYLAFIGLILSGCQDKSTEPVKTIDLKTFQLQTPANWQSIAQIGYDSQVGSLTNGRDLLSYDYGWYSYDLRNEVSPDYVRTNMVIDGQTALLVRPKRRGTGVIGIYLLTKNQNRFVMSGTNIQDEATVLKIFESITFQ